MLTTTLLFTTSKAHAYTYDVWGETWTPCCGLFTWYGTMTDGGMHGHLHTNWGDYNWTVLHPHQGPNGNPILDTYATYNDFLANNTVTDDETGLDPASKLALYNSFATQIDNGNYTVEQ